MRELRANHARPVAKARFVENSSQGPKEQGSPSAQTWPPFTKLGRAGWLQPLRSAESHFSLNAVFFLGLETHEREFIRQSFAGSHNRDEHLSSLYLPCVRVRLKGLRRANLELHGPAMGIGRQLLPGNICQESHFQQS